MDQIAFVKGKLMLTLYNSRDDSLTFGRTLAISITEEEPKLVQVPPEVWHGFKAVEEESAYLLHLNPIAFSFDEIDEDRLPPNDPWIPYMG